MKRICLVIIIMSIALMRADAQEPLNIVFILADDWGWTDWQMNGHKGGSTLYETPSLNKLASEGVYSLLS